MHSTAAIQVRFPTVSLILTTISTQINQHVRSCVYSNSYRSNLEDYSDRCVSKGLVYSHIHIHTAAISVTIAIVAYATVLLVLLATDLHIKKYLHAYAYACACSSLSLSYAFKFHSHAHTAAISVTIAIVVYPTVSLIPIAIPEFSGKLYINKSFNNACRRTKFAPVKSVDSSEFSSEFSDLKTL